MFTSSVQQKQRAEGSFETYARMSARDAPDGLGADEKDFLSARTSCYLATVSETGWPYVQHRGGPAGFIKLLDTETIAFADYRGNRQLVSTGNLVQNAKVSLFAMDYPRKARLKLQGYASVHGIDDDADLAAQVATGGEGKPERIMVIKVAAFDWNCPQFITPRFDTSELAALVGPEITRLENRVAELEAELAEHRLKEERKPI